MARAQSEFKKKNKKLILLNGRWGISGKEHIYICANSVADAARICGELSKSSRGWINEIKTYFSKGCWRNPMQGINPERGAWIGKNFGTEKPMRVYPPA
jgi:hypothetical protein